jgi:TonB family protein
MSTGTTATFSRKVASTRKVPRYRLAVPLDLTVLRSGIPDSISARTLELGEGGVGVIIDSQLRLGESVRVEFLLPHMSNPVRATAIVRYQRARCAGLEFLRLPMDQQSVIRYWTRHEGELLLGKKSDRVPATARSEQPASNLTFLAHFADSKSRPRTWRILNLAVAVILLTALGWWRWQQAWTELEAPATIKPAALARPQRIVPAEEMQRRIRHQVPPEYPDQALSARVQGTVVLNVVVNSDGNVAEVNRQSGPDLLSAAAMDAVRWWRYEPYLSNGQPVTVETTVEVSFRLPNK